MKTVQEIDRIIVTALVEDIVTNGYSVYSYSAEGSLLTSRVDAAVDYILELEECTIEPVTVGDIVDGGGKVDAISLSCGGIYLTPGENGWDIICNSRGGAELDRLMKRADAIAHRYMLQDEASELHRLGDSALLRLIYTELSDLGFGSTEDINGADVVENINAWFGALDARFGG